MHVPLKLLVSCSLLLCATACTHWSEPVAQEQQPRRTTRPLTKLEPALAAPLPPATPSRFCRGPELLDTSIEDPIGASCGILDDMLLDPETGEVAAILVSLRQPEGARAVLEYGSVRWVLTEQGQPVALLAPELRGAALHGHDYREAFEVQQITRVVGEVTDIEVLEPTVGASVLFKVLDQGNLLHRVLLEPCSLGSAGLLNLTRGERIEVEGAFTRDQIGKLLVASSVKQDSRTLSLRDSTGAVRWGALSESLQSARKIAGAPLTTSDGATLFISDWIMDRETGRAIYLSLELEGEERFLAWDEVKGNGAGGWRVERDKSSLAELPSARSDLPFLEAL